MSRTRDEQLLLERFKKRCEANRGKQIRNQDLPAGAPMYFYCRHCGVQTDVLAESYTCRPVTICAPCGELEKRGLLK